MHASDEPGVAILLTNVGTPDAPTVRAVRRYLREFLGDPLVLDMPAFVRFMLLNFVILPFRPKESAHAYKQIWTPEGSPLVVWTEKLVQKLQTRLRGKAKVAFAMRYGTPSIEETITALLPFERLIIQPLYPQYAAATHATSSLAVLHWVQEQTARHNSANVPALEIRGDFYQHAAFIEAYAQKLRNAIAEYAPDHVLFSYHGLPQSQCVRSETGPVDCNRQGPCAPIPEHTSTHRMCYRAQCYETTRALCGAVSLTGADYSVSFQSRLGRTPWIKPYTDEMFPVLAKQGVQRLLVISPAFVTDCLETLEELDIRGAKQWQTAVHASGGTNAQFQRVPCLNADDLWVDALVELLR